MAKGEPTALDEAETLLGRADEARAAGDPAAAAVAYGAALQRLPAAGAEAEVYRVRIKRTYCLHQAGDYAAEELELGQLEQLAERLGGIERRIDLDLRWAELQLIYGNAATAQLLAARALAAAEHLGLPLLTAEVLFVRAQIAYQQGTTSVATALAERALAIFRVGGARSGESRALRVIGLAILGTQPSLARAHLREALSVSRSCGDRSAEALALNALGTAASDYTERRAAYQQALMLAEQLGDRATEVMIANNLGTVYEALGLYQQARRFAMRAVRRARDLGARDLLASCLDTLGRALGGGGDLGAARSALREAYALAELVGNHGTAAAVLISLAQADLAEGQVAAAQQALERAAQRFAEQGFYAEQAHALAWQAACQIEVGAWSRAVEVSGHAVALIEEDAYSSDFPPQEIWWVRFQALRAASAAHEPDQDEQEGLAGFDKGWQRNTAALLALRRAREAMYATIANLRDPGLRRCYLSRVTMNRAIVEALAHIDRVQRPRPASGGYWNLYDPLALVLAVSGRLNELRDAQALYERFLDELVELSGAERILLLIGRDLDHPEVLLGRGEANDRLSQAHQTVLPLLRKTVQQRQGIIHTRTEGVARTAMIVPLTSGASSMGVLYAEVRDVFGPFTKSDLDMVSVLAAHAATAFEHARLYQQTLQAKEDLEQQVAQRTADLQAANAALQRRTAEAQAAMASAEAASAAKSAFLANVSHELRTPLNAVIGFAQVLERDPSLQVEQRELVGIIARSGDHLLGLINDVLELARMEAGRMRLNPAPFDLQRMFRDLDAFFRLSAEQRRLGLRLNYGADLPRYVVGDEGRMRQILINLISNAIKFTQAGGVQVRAMSEASGERVRVRVSVADTGEGIAPSELGLLFQPFVQTTSGQRSQEGTGLGLALSRQLARLMGGDISVSSVIGVGSTFVVEVLLDHATTPVGSKTGLTVNGLVTAGRRYRALVVSTVWQQRRLYVEWLRQAGLEVREADDERRALASLAQWRPHLTLLTASGVGMDGYGLARQIKATAEGRATVVIVLDERHDREMQPLLGTTGCDEVLSSQVRYEELLSAVAQLLGLDLRYSEASPAPHERPLRCEDLAVLPEQLRVRLGEAAALNDPALVEAAVVAVQAGWPELGARLAALADEFAFDQIEQLVVGG